MGISRRTLLKTAVLAPVVSSLGLRSCPPGGVGPPPKDAGHFDVIIIGTGFGATVAATKLALEKGKKNILMLERGVWWNSPERPLPDYLKTLPEDQLKKELQYWPRPDHRKGVIDLLNKVRTNNPVVEAFRSIAGLPQPLYRYNSFDEIDILTASGVGGGSLIYSNVTIAPHFDPGVNRFPVMEGWPLPLAPQDYKDAVKWMTDHRGAPVQVVTKFPMPEANYPHRDQFLEDNPYLYLGRSRWLKEAAKALQSDPQWGQKRVQDWKPLDLQIIEYPDNSTPDLNKKTFCERQGRCFLGCLPGARHTLNKTLARGGVENLLSGPNPPVQLQSLADVNRIERFNGGYKVFYDNLHVDDFDPERKKFVSAPVVILASGVLGTTELLLRSEGDNFRFSDKLGRQFSTNGDSAGFVTYSSPFPYGISATRGPINTSHVMYADGNLFINVEDAGIPAMLASAVKGAIDAFVNATNRDAFFRDMKALWKLTGADRLPLDPNNPRAFDTEQETLQNTFFFNVMGRDAARGRFTLNELGQLTLSFEGGPLSKDPVFKRIDDLMHAMSKAMGHNGQYVRFPFWGRIGFLGNEYNPERKVVTVHPLGGCPMGNSATDGVVDTKGRVFKATPDATGAVYDGLYVMDASVIPGPLAVNPTLTIVAYALKIADSIP